MKSKIDKNHHNTRIKRYGGQLAEIMVCSRPIFNDHQTEQSPAEHAPAEQSPAEHSPAELMAAQENAEATDRERSKRRAKKAVYDLIACNSDLDYFVTLTLDPKKIDRYDYDLIYKKLRVWLDNRVRRKGLKYVLVAEYHKDKAIHFHALCNGGALKLADSGKTDSQGHKVYNLEDWTLGFTTAVKTYGKNRAALVNYVVKYITKSDAPVGGRWYYSGGNLARPEYEYEDVLNYDEMFQLATAEELADMGKPFDVKIEGAGLEFRIMRTTSIKPTQPDECKGNTLDNKNECKGES